MGDCCSTGKEKLMELKKNYKLKVKKIKAVTRKPIPG